MITKKYNGVIIEESLENAEVLREVKIESTRVEKVNERHATPWLRQWTLHSVEIPANKADKVAMEISRSLDSKHGGSWYADFKNDKYHYIIFRNKIFFIDRQSAEQYNEAKQYGLSLGIPEHQVDFNPDAS